MTQTPTDLSRPDAGGHGNVRVSGRGIADRRALVPAPTRSTLPVPDVVTLAGVHFTCLTEEAVADYMLALLEQGRGGWVITPNIDILRQISRSPALAAMAGQADLCIADGMPVVWASRLISRALPERVAGANLVPRLCRLAARSGRSVFLLGAAPAVALESRFRLESQIEGLQVAGTYSPPMGFESDPGELAFINQVILDSGADLVFCAFGFPKQERLMAECSRIFPGVWFVGCGGTLDYLAGAVPRAPVWMQDRGLEWLHRLRCEPRRLFRRYIVGDLPFAARFLVGALFERWPRAPRGKLTRGGGLVS
jgi:N-acetylglucosaminyldiphosphoundecaprenol N-acetyl-beta-D-mannosaminyltransferase